MSTSIPLPPRNTGIRPNNTGSRDCHSYIKLAYEFSEPVKVALSFDELNLKADLIKALNRYGVRVPYGIQQCAVLPAINGRNVIAQAPSKAGKSIAVAISLAQLTDAYERGVQALIISPTEQKAIDIESIIGSLGHKCYRSRNNQPVEHDLAQIAAGYNCPILLGTPQRVLYLLRRNILRTSELKIMALDDLDTLLDNGFNLQISEIYQLLPRSVRTLCTGSNLSSDALREAHRYMSNPILLNVGKDNRVLSTTSHSFIIIPSTHKFSMLYGLLKNTSVRRQVVILCDTFDEARDTFFTCVAIPSHRMI
ncbi:P-loop containing nucleoside triphosphate hydrolase protein [Rhizoctonia solani]|nr:P-loop containing nucleoside triphosphate hydrolase protein [Rhizoctonia solani]